MRECEYSFRLWKKQNGLRKEVDTDRFKPNFTFYLGSKQVLCRFKSLGVPNVCSIDWCYCMVKPVTTREGGACEASGDPTTYPAPLTHNNNVYTHTTLPTIPLSTVVCPRMTTSSYRNFHCSTPVLLHVFPVFSI